MNDPTGWLSTVQSMKSESLGFAVIGVLSVAIVYTLGAAVSRLAQDFFNDDDLLLGYVPTEDQIRAGVYRSPLERVLLVNPVTGKEEEQRKEAADTISALEDSGTNRQDTRRWFRGPHADETPTRSERIRQIFSIQEAALLLAGEDKVSRIRLLHQQLNVLRGAAFDGLIACLLCLMGWNVKTKWGPWHWKRSRWLLPIGLLLYALYALVFNHFKLLPDPQQRLLRFDDPPFMELFLLVVCGCGLYAVSKGTKGSWPRGTGWVLLLFTALAYSGWYWTEILYDRLIIDSFYASQHLLPK
jgi:hypothetical protein